MTSSDLSQYKAKLQDYVTAAQQCGFKKLVNFGIDETTADVLTQEFPAFDAVHAAGAMNFITQFNFYNPFSVSGLPSRIDFVTFPRFSTTDAANWHSVGAKVLNYANPHPYCEVPLVYRQNYGWQLFKSNFDGAFDYVYQACFSSPDDSVNGLLWNDFTVPVGQHRQQCYAYPTTNGVVDTVQFEGLREAVNDMRYLATLQKAITNHPGPTANAAQVWINRLTRMATWMRRGCRWLLG